MTAGFHPRYFHVRCRSGFDEELLAAVVKGYAEWRAWVDETLAGWETDEYRKRLPKPDYKISEPTLSDDRSTVTVTLDGDPHTYGAMKTFEDGVPLHFYVYIPSSKLPDIEIAYENEDFLGLGRAALQWHAPSIPIDAQIVD
jgi:hypothetical protein